jgi:hypothetical protein
MKSIWSKGYIPFKDSNPFTKSISNQANKINRPTTLGLTKTISTVLNETQITKRKFEPESQYTSSIGSSVVDSDYATDSNENEYSDEINNKRIKIEENDIDCLLSEYKSIENKQLQRVSSSPPVRADQSPIVNKNSEKRQNSKYNFYFFLFLNFYNKFSCTGFNLVRLIRLHLI